MLRDEGNTYISIKRAAEELVDRTIVGRGISSLRRDHTCWYGSYRPIGNPTEVDITCEAEFDYVVTRTRN